MLRSEPARIGRQSAVDCGVGIDTTGCQSMNRRPLFFLLAGIFLVVALGAGSVNAAAPVLLERIPSAGSTNFSLPVVEIQFSENVNGVDAGDLLVNGVPAEDVEAFGTAHYV